MSIIFGALAGIIAPLAMIDSATFVFSAAFFGLILDAAALGIKAYKGG